MENGKKNIFFTKEDELEGKKQGDSLINGNRLLKAIIFATKTYVSIFFIIGLIGSLVTGDSLLDVAPVFLVHGCVFDYSTCMFGVPFVPLISIYGALFLFGVIFYKKQFFIKINSSIKNFTFFVGIFLLVSVIIYLTGSSIFNYFEDENYKNKAWGRVIYYYNNTSKNKLTILDNFFITEESRNRDDVSVYNNKLLRIKASSMDGVGYESMVNNCKNAAVDNLPVLYFVYSWYSPRKNKDVIMEEYCLFGAEEINKFKSEILKR